MVRLIKPPLDRDDSLDKIQVKEPNHQKARESMEAAKGLAEKGHLDSMEIMLTLARKRGADIDELKKIQREAYEKKLKSELAWARRYIGELTLGDINLVLSFAEEYADRLGENIDAELQEIREKAEAAMNQ